MRVSGLRPVTVALTRLSYRDRENRLNPADVHLSNWRPDRPAAGVRASGSSARRSLDVTRQSLVIAPAAAPGTASGSSLW